MVWCILLWCLGDEGFAMVFSEDERRVERRRKKRGGEVQERRNDDATRHPEVTQAVYSDSS